VDGLVALEAGLEDADGFAQVVLVDDVGDAGLVRARLGVE